MKTMRCRALSVISLARPYGFSGKIHLREDNLELPLRTKKPTVFAIWNDLYHEDVPDAFRDRAYAVMALCPQHTFLVLTKRAEGMAEYLRGAELEIRDEIKYNAMAESVQWPLPNVWHGVTAENQQTTNERIPHLLRVPGKKFVSIEPMLGPVNLDRIHEVHGPREEGWESCLNGRRLDEWSERGESSGYPSIHAVLLGGESGPNARSMHPDWARGVRDQCAEASVPFFFKQWGEWASFGNGYDVCNDKRYQNQKMPQVFVDDDGPFTVTLGEKCLRRTAIAMNRVGKKRAGRTLDGVIHNALPWDEA